MADRLDEVNAEFEDMDSEADDNSDGKGADIGSESIGMTDSGAESEMIDLDAINTGKKAVSGGNGKVVNIGKYRAV